MDKRFTTKAQAAEAGYVQPRWSALKDAFAASPDLRIFVVDVSGPHSEGYEFALKVHSAHDIYHEGGPDDHRRALLALGDRELARTETVWFTDELNNMRQPGGFAARFSPEAIEQAQQLWGQAQADYAQALTEARQQRDPGSQLGYDEVVPGMGG